MGMLNANSMLTNLLSIGKHVTRPSDDILINLFLDSDVYLQMTPALQYV